MNSPPNPPNGTNTEPKKNLGIDFEEQIIWFNKNNENTTWIIHQTPSLTNRGREFLKKFDYPDPIESEEWLEMEADCTRLLEQWKIDINGKSAISVWVNRTKKLFDQKRKKPQARNLIAFLARLSATPLNSVRGAMSHESNQTLPSTVISLAWIGINTTLGAIGKKIKPTCFDGEIIPISTLGQTIIDSSPESTKTAFHKDKILINGNEGVHDICQWAISADLGSSDSTTL